MIKETWVLEAQNTHPDTMPEEIKSRLFDLLTKYHYDPKVVRAITFIPHEQSCVFEVMQYWPDGKPAVIDKQLLVEDEPRPMNPVDMLPFLPYATKSALVQ